MVKQDVSYDVEGTFILSTETNAFESFMEEGRSIIEDFTETGVANTFAIYPPAYSRLSRSQKLVGVTVITNGDLEY